MQDSFYIRDECVQEILEQLRRISPSKILASIGSIFLALVHRQASIHSPPFSPESTHIDLNFPAIPHSPPQPPIPFENFPSQCL